MIDLGTLPGGSFSAATGINRRGQVAGFSHVDTPAGPPFPFDVEQHGFFWENGVMIDLGTLPGTSGPYSSATGINNHGEIAGYAEGSTGAVSAVIWIPMRKVLTLS